MGFFHICQPWKHMGSMLRKAGLQDRVLGGREERAASERSICSLVRRMYLRGPQIAQLKDPTQIELWRNQPKEMPTLSENPFCIRSHYPT